MARDQVAHRGRSNPIFPLRFQITPSSTYTGIQHSSHNRHITTITKGDNKMPMVMYVGVINRWCLIFSNMVLFMCSVSRMCGLFFPGRPRPFRACPGILRPPLVFHLPFVLFRGGFLSPRLRSALTMFNNPKSSTRFLFSPVR